MVWDVMGELGRAVREALRDWPGTFRLLCIGRSHRGVGDLAVAAPPRVEIRCRGQDAVDDGADSWFWSDEVRAAGRVQ